MALVRQDNWTELFHSFVMARISAPFAWGKNDCALFVADAINSMTGVDLGAGLRGEYSSLAGAAVTMATLTGKQGATVEDVAEHFAAQAGMPERKGPLFAQRGDVALFDSANGPAMGMVYLDGAQCLFVSQDGLNRVPLKSCRKAWKV